MSDAVWISAITGVVTLASLLMTLLIRKDQHTLKKEMNGHMSKLLEKTAEVGVEQGKAEEKSAAADIKIKELEIKIKPETELPDAG